MGTDQADVDKLLAAGPPDWVAVALPSEVPAHDVTQSTGYWIDRTEVTNAMFGAFKDAGGYTTESYWSPEGWDWVGHRVVAGLPKPCEGDAPDVPRRCITWYEAEAYAAWRGGRLPTEAEWEFAARGPSAVVYPWGDAWDPAKANVVDSAGPAPVGSHPVGESWVGAQDMAGNAMEWVSDWLGPYSDAPATDPTGPAEGTIKVEKGGWWGSNPFVARSAYRHYEDPPTYSDEHIGFRVVSES
jgi:formylglycine-generating enzyme required for sulfatase activity